MENKFSFHEFNLSDEIFKSIQGLGYEVPSEVQQRVIPLALEGKNLIVKSETGTGKTAAFGIPLCEMIELEEKKTQAVILTPTRELAVQVAKDLNDLGRFKRLRAMPIFGGQPIEIQLKSLKQRVHIIVSTPGRLLDHIERESIALEMARFLIIDEADEMFNMGFIDDVKKIIEKMPENKQMMLFSATMTEKVKNITEKYMKDSINIESAHNKVTVDKIEQIFYVVEEKNKLSSLNRVLSTLESSSVIIFCNTKKAVDEVTKYLTNKDFEAQSLHGDMTQEDRLRVIGGFKNGNFNYLVATDVAARGIDVEDISHVVNYDVPYYSENYVHRIGRTARAGKEGTAITLVEQHEIRFLKAIEEYTETSIKKKELPSYNQAMLQKQKKEEHKQSIDNGNKSLVEKTAKKKKDLSTSKEITKLHISLGRKNKIRPTDVVGAITGTAGIAGEDIGIIDIYDNFTFVDIMNGKGKKVLELMKDTTIKGKKVKVEVAKEKQL